MVNKPGLTAEMTQNQPYNSSDFQVTSLTVQKLELWLNPKLNLEQGEMRRVRTADPSGDHDRG
jgi:hypothetical protein